MSRIFPRPTVFVSSTIHECAAERSAAREAIEDLGLEAILFEERGASPHPPRAFYLSDLRRAQICVAIWKKSYGWIDAASGMTISGVEDEFLEAKKNDVDVLLYVSKEESDRDPRLVGLIQTAGVKYSIFDDVAKLRDRIRDDIIQLLSSSFLSRFSSSSHLLTAPSASLQRQLRGTLPIVHRMIASRIDELSRANSAIWFWGASGSGKTVLATQWAATNGHAYVNARGLDIRTVLHLGVAALTGTTPKASDFPLTIQQGVDQLEAAWRSASARTIVVDDPSAPLETASIFREIGLKVGPMARLVLVTQEESAPAWAKALHAAPLTHEEIEAFAQAATEPETARRIRDLLSAQRPITPIEIRGLVSSARLVSPLGQFSAIAPRTRELLSYIAASTVALTLDELTELVGADAISPVEIDESLGALPDLVLDDGVGFRVLHEALRAELTRELAERPALRRLVYSRLGALFTRGDRPLAAFEMLREVEHASALAQARRAARLVSREGGLAQAIAPLTYIAEELRKKAPTFDLAFTLLALGQARLAVGMPGAEDNLDEAFAVASTVGDEHLIELIADQKDVAEAQRDFSSASLAKLRETRARYLREGRAQDAARMAVDESVVLMASARESEAIDILREAREIFIGTKDPYGVEIATRNLIMCLELEGDATGEGEKLSRELDAAQSGFSAQRHRAWVCNMQSRRLRKDGLFDEAIAAAREAIGIAAHQNDKHLETLNRIALGNAQRSKGELADAIETFKLCGRDAAAIGRPDLDGRASRLAAEVLVELAKKGAPVNRASLLSEAEAFATQTIALLRGTIAEHEVAEALDARGDARDALGAKNEADEDYAAAVPLFLSSGATEYAGCLSAFVARRLMDENTSRAIQILRIIVGAGGEAGSSLEDLMTAFAVLPSNLPIAAAGPATAVLLRHLQRGAPIDIETAFVLRALSMLDWSTPTDDKGTRGALIFGAAIATRRGALTSTELVALASLSLAKSSNVVFRSFDAGPLQLSLSLGSDDGVLLVITDMDRTPETLLISLSLCAFFEGHREELNRELFSGVQTPGASVRLAVLSYNGAPADLQASIDKQGEDRPVLIAGSADKTGPTDLILVCKPDAGERLRGDPTSATELQFLYADVLRAVLFVAYGGEIEEEIVRPKILSVLRQTIQ